MDILASVLESPYTWGVVAIVLSAIAISGKLSMNAARLLLGIAWATAVFATYRSLPIIIQLPIRYAPTIPRSIGVALMSALWGLCLCLLAVWMASSSKASTKKADLSESRQTPTVVIDYKITSRRALSPGETDAPEFRAKASPYRIPITNLEGGTAYAITIEPITKDGVTATFSTIDVLGVGKPDALDCRIEWAEGVSRDGPMKLFEKERTTLTLTDWLARDHRASIPLRLTYLDRDGRRFVASCTLEYNNLGQLLTVNNSPAKRATGPHTKG